MMQRRLWWHRNVTNAYQEKSICSRDALINVPRATQIHSCQSLEQNRTHSRQGNKTIASPELLVRTGHCWASLSHISRIAILRNLHIRENQSWDLTLVGLKAKPRLSPRFLHCSEGERWKNSHPILLIRHRKGEVATQPGREKPRFGLQAPGISKVPHLTPCPTTSRHLLPT